MELLKLLGIVIVIAGFALKLDSILVILVAAVVTALVGGLGPVTLLETLGSTFVANRSMAIFIIVMLPIGILTSYVLWRRGRFRAPRHHAHGRRCHCGTGL